MQRVSFFKIMSKITANEWLWIHWIIQDLFYSKVTVLLQKVSEEFGITNHFSTRRSVKLQNVFLKWQIVKFK